ncbi:MAG: MerR family DNA-binding transcriptional regulator [Oscillospiraceae bacterium]|nr:MerR family DNA-binding transcriptional regulator [Oscillospiraceae bacterium]
MDESALLSIKKFSEFTGVSQSTLRYYDEIGLLPAASRGENNYRYYTPFQIIKLNYINVLVDLGVPLSKIKDMNIDRSPEAMIDLLSQQEVKLDRQLYELRTAYSIIHTYRMNIQKGLMAHNGLIRVEELDETHYVLGHLNDYDFINHPTFYEEFIRFCMAAHKRRINLRYPVGGYHDDMSIFLTKPNRPDRYFSLDPLGNNIRPAGKYLVGYHQGYYGEFGDLPQKMAEYAGENNLVFRGPVFVVFLLDEITIVEPEQYMSSISVAVTPKKQSRTRKINN